MINFLAGLILLTSLINPNDKCHEGLGVCSKCDFKIIISESKNKVSNFHLDFDWIYNFEFSVQENKKHIFDNCIFCLNKKILEKYSAKKNYYIGGKLW